MRILEFTPNLKTVIVLTSLLGLVGIPLSVASGNIGLVVMFVIGLLFLGYSYSVNMDDTVSTED